jgi:hypothetical protein
MRANIPTPVVVAILAAVVLALGYVLWRGSSPGAGAEETEARLKRAFGGRVGPGGAPPVPPVGPGAVQPAGPTGGAPAVNR